MENKKRDGGSQPKKDREQAHSVFHDDENLQDIQDAFDAANPPEKRAEALENLMRGFPAKEEIAKRPRQFTITIGSGYADSLRRAELSDRMPWISELVGKTISTTSGEYYLDLVEAEADCVIWLSKLDLLRESKNPDENEPKHIGKKVEHALENLRRLVNHHRG